jgi:hypothetical protein
VAERVRIIEYDFAPPEHLQAVVGVDALNCLPDVGDVGVLRCVRKDGSKVTLVGDAQRTRAVVAGDDAVRREGIRLPDPTFPVIRNGWPGRFPNEKKKKAKKRARA